MTERQLVRATLVAVDDFIDQLSRDPAWQGFDVRPEARPPRLVVDEGRAAVEWTLDLRVGSSMSTVGLLLVCDVEGAQVTDARLYFSPHRAGDHERTAAP
jgi:hypothetical protein